MEETRLDDYQLPLWCAAFGVETLDGLFDLATPASAISVLDAAINKFHHDADSLRPFLAKEDPRGLSGNVRTIEQMRVTLATYTDASITGLFEE